jgi:hypothetical protein
VNAHAPPESHDGSGHSRMWHVTLTFAGDPVNPREVRGALERLAHEHPFLLAGRYAADRVEVRYWEEARDAYDAAALALRLWGEHRVSAGLPPWAVVGLEILERETYQQRLDEPTQVFPVAAVGVRPF